MAGGPLHLSFVAEPWESGWRLGGLLVQPRGRSCCGERPGVRLGMVDASQRFAFVLLCWFFCKRLRTPQWNVLLALEASQSFDDMQTEPLSAVGSVRRCGWRDGVAFSGRGAHSLRKTIFSRFPRGVARGVLFRPVSARHPFYPPTSAQWASSGISTPEAPWVAPDELVGRLASKRRNDWTAAPVVRTVDFK